jgi:hypothetical protein
MRRNHLHGLKSEKGSECPRTFRLVADDGLLPLDAIAPSGKR